MPPAPPVPPVPPDEVDVPAPAPPDPDVSGSEEQAPPEPHRSASPDNMPADSHSAPPLARVTVPHWHGLDDPRLGTVESQRPIAVAMLTALRAKRFSLAASAIDRIALDPGDKVSHARRVLAHPAPEAAAPIFAIPEIPREVRVG